MELNASALLRRSIKKGFTLAEVLVTIAIIAIMAAVLLPALNSQLSKGDTSRIASDLTNLQSGVQAFFSDVRQYPDSTAQLIGGLSASSTDVNGNSFQASAIASWKGPYVSRDVLSNTGGRAAFAPQLTKTVTGGGTFLTANISPITPESANNLESTLDEGTTSSTSSTSGNVRYSSTNKTLSFLLMPIQ